MSEQLLQDSVEGLAACPKGSRARLQFQGPARDAFFAFADSWIDAAAGRLDGVLRFTSEEEEPRGLILGDVEGERLVLTRHRGRVVLRPIEIVADETGHPEEWIQQPKDDLFPGLLALLEASIAALASRAQGSADLGTALATLRAARDKLA